MSSEGRSFGCQRRQQNVVKIQKNFQWLWLLGFLLIKRILTSLFFTLFLTTKKAPSRSVAIPDSIPNVSQENKVFQSVLETFFGEKYAGNRKWNIAFMTCLRQWILNIDVGSLRGFGSNRLLISRRSPSFCNSEH